VQTISPRRPVGVKEGEKKRGRSVSRVLCDGETDDRRQTSVIRNSPTMHDQIDQAEYHRSQHVEAVSIQPYQRIDQQV
jgi:hypothetical protein